MKTDVRELGLNRSDKQPACRTRPQPVSEDRKLAAACGSVGVSLPNVCLSTPEERRTPFSLRRFQWGKHLGKPGIEMSIIHSRNAPVNGRYQSWRIARIVIRVVVNPTQVGTASEPGQQFQRSVPTTADFVFGNIMPTFLNPQLNSCNRDIRRKIGNINQHERAAILKHRFDYRLVLTGTQNRFNNNTLIFLQTILELCENFIRRLDVCIPQDVCWGVGIISKPLRVQDFESTDIWICVIAASDQRVNRIRRGDGRFSDTIRPRNKPKFRSVHEADLLLGIFRLWHLVFINCRLLGLVKPFGQALGEVRIAIFHQIIFDLFLRPCIGRRGYRAGDGRCGCFHIYSLQGRRLRATLVSTNVD